MQLVTIRDAVADLGISRPTLYRLLAKHNLTTYSRGGDREAYVDIDALRKIRDQFVPRRQVAIPVDGSAPSAGASAQRP
jgi:hypothetical protein